MRRFLRRAPALLGVGGAGGIGPIMLIDQGNPNAGGTAAWPVQGADAVGAPATGRPVHTGAIDVAGNIQPFRVAVFPDVNGTLLPAVTAQRVVADMMVQDALNNVTNRVRSANSNVAGVGGGAIPGVGAMAYDSAAALFKPMLGDASGRQIAVGAAAAGAAVTGNPLLVGITDSVNVQTWRQWDGGSGNQGKVGTPVVLGCMESIEGSNDSRPLTAASRDGIAATLVLAGAPMMFNGTDYDRARNNVDVTLLASAARTTLQTSADIKTYNNQAITVILDMTAVGAGPSVTVSIDGKDPASGKYYNLLTGAAITTVTTNVYRIDETIPAVANLIAQLRLPRVIRIVVTPNNANAGTYSVGYTLHSPGG